MSISRREKEMNDSESLDQQALFEWAEWNPANLKGLDMMLTFRDEVKKNYIPDIFLPVPKGIFHGLWIEMKSESGETDKEQNEWIKKLNVQGYYATSCYSWDDAKELIQDYLYNTIKKLM